MTYAATTSFAAIGTTVVVAVRDARDLEPARRLAQGVLVDVDEVCSRFRADSDLSRVNAAPDRWVAVDPLLVHAVEIACAAARLTGGLVNPLLGRSLAQLGYDRDFGLLVELAEPTEPTEDSLGTDHPTESPLPPLDAWQEIRLDPAGRLRIPAGSALDLGATGKAWAADLIAAAYHQHLRGSALVSVGGDLRIAAPDGIPWLVAVSERPGGPAELVELDAGGMATSTTRIRRWTRHGVRRHHLLDPRTGRPAPEVWRTVTATGATCTAANTASTAAVVLGADAPQWLEQHAVTARLVSARGDLHPVGDWPTAPERRVA